MMQRYKRILCVLLIGVLLLSFVPCFPAAAAYNNGYAGGMAGDGNGIYAYGVDLSEWQGYQVDFDRLKETGCRFVILRIGFSTTIDQTFEENYHRAKAAGLDVGVYLYSYADTPEQALREANACKGWLAGKQLEYPVYFDLEDPETHGGLSREALTQIAFSFLDAMAAEGWLVGLYSCLSWLVHKMDTPQLCAQYECWMAQYPSDGSYEDYDRYDEVYGMWQYSSTGTVEGISGNVDMNVCFKDYPSICRQYGFNGYAPSGESLLLSGVTVPKLLKTGESFALSGKVTTTQGTLSSVTVGVYNGENEMLTGRSASGGSKECDLSTLESGLKLNTLTEGKYYFKISATNSKGSRTLLHQVLYVSNSGVASEEIGVPENMKQGDAFAPCGMVYSAATLEQVTVAVSAQNNSPVVTAQATPGGKEYDLSALGTQLDLTTLVPGSYTYLVTARSGGTTVELLRQGFHVWTKDDPLTVENISLQPEYYLGQLTGLEGKLVSAKSDIQDMTIAVYDAKEAVVRATRAQNIGSSADLSGYGKQLELATLETGSYRMVIRACNAGGPVEVLNSHFLIRRDTISLSEFSGPRVLCEGDSATICGAIASDRTPLSFVSVSVRDAGGNHVLNSAAIPASNLYDLSKLNSALAFSDLSAGVYTLCVIGENENNAAILYEEPLTVFPSEDLLGWKDDCFTPQGMSFSLSNPFYLWGTLTSAESPIASVEIAVLNETGEEVIQTKLTPEQQEVDLGNYNVVLRLAALPPGSYLLRITAENATASAVLLDSPFVISECLHQNVRSGNVHRESCISSGAVCASYCLDCGDMVRNGVLLPMAEHQYQEEKCILCGRGAYARIRAEKIQTLPVAGSYFVIAAENNGQWYALDLNGNTQRITGPDPEGKIYVTADLLWTLHSKKGELSIVNAWGDSLHLDSRGVVAAPGKVNGTLQLVQREDGCSLSLENGRRLTLEGAMFTVNTGVDELSIFLYIP